MVLAAAALAGGACSAGAPSPAPGTAATTVRLTTGIPGASFHPLGAGLAVGYERALAPMRVEVQESPGSVRNVQALQRGSADIGFAFADVTYVAYVGQLLADPTPHDRLRGVAVLQLTPLHVLVRKGLRVKDIRDLWGKRIGSGPPGSGTAFTSGILMQAFGVGAGDVAAEPLPFNEASQRLVDGTLDAAFVSAGYPSEAVDIATRAGAQMLTVQGPTISALRTAYPFLRLTFIPAHTYPGHSEPVATVGVDSLLLCRADLDEELVYQLTKALFDMLPELSTDLSSLQLMDIDRAPATPIPLHRGAARYYRERELRR